MSFLSCQKKVFSDDRPVNRRMAWNTFGFRDSRNTSRKKKHACHTHWRSFWHNTACATRCADIRHARSDVKKTSVKVSKTSKTGVCAKQKQLRKSAIGVDWLFSNFKVGQRFPFVLCAFAYKTFCLLSAIDSCRNQWQQLLMNKKLARQDEKSVH